MVEMHKNEHKSSSNQLSRREHKIIKTDSQAKMENTFDKKNSSLKTLNNPEANKISNVSSQKMNESSIIKAKAEKKEKGDNLSQFNTLNPANTLGLLNTGNLVNNTNNNINEKSNTISNSQSHKMQDRISLNKEEEVKGIHVEENTIPGKNLSLMNKDKESDTFVNLMEAESEKEEKVFKLKEVVYEPLYNLV